MLLRISPVAVPDKIFGLMLILDFIDRCHSLRSLHPPLAALPSFPHGLKTVHRTVFFTAFQIPLTNTNANKKTQPCGWVSK